MSEIFEPTPESSTKKARRFGGKLTKGYWHRYDKNPSRRSQSLSRDQSWSVC